MNRLNNYNLKINELTMDMMNLEAFISALFGGLVGALVMYLSSFAKKKGELVAVNENYSNLLEQTKRTTNAVKAIEGHFTTRVTFDTELRTAIREFTMAVSSALHSMSWITWEAGYRERLDKEMIESYDKELHLLHPQIYGQLMVIASFSKDLYAELKHIPPEINDLDTQVATKIVEFRSRKKEQVEEMKELKKEIGIVADKIPTLIADLVGNYSLLGVSAPNANAHTESSAL